MAYKAPVWEDGKAPAISAENLNALSQAAEGAQVLYGNSAPTSSTEGAVGQFYLVVVAGSDGNYPLYQCVAIANGSYTWRDVLTIPASLAAEVGLGDPATIRDAIARLALSPAGTGTLYVHCKDEAGEPVSGCVVQIGEELAVTGASGAVKYFLTPGTYSVTIRSPIDYGAEIQTFSVTVLMSQIVSVDVTILDNSNGETVRTFTSGLVAAFSGRVSKADVCAVGGGGSGGMAWRRNDSYPYGAAAGGAGGHVDNVLDMDLSEAFVVSVGLGGAANTVNATSGATYAGKDGGESSVVTLSGRNLAKAPGGEGGQANDSVYGIDGASGGSGSAAIYKNGGQQLTGPAGEDGADGATVTYSNTTYVGGTGQGKTTRAFGESDGELFSSAGASVAIQGDVIKNEPGTGAGAADGFYSSASASTVEVSAEDATTPGSGGGAVGAIIYSSKATSKVVMKSGAGANGLVRFRWEVAA